MVLRNKNKCNFHYVTIPMMASQILKSVDFKKNTKMQIPHELNITYSSNKKFINCTSRAYCKKQFCSGGNFYFWYYRLLLYYGIFKKNWEKISAD